MCLLTNNTSVWALTKKSSKAPFLVPLETEIFHLISMEEKIGNYSTSLLNCKTPEQQYEDNIIFCLAVSGSKFTQLCFVLP